MYLLLEEVVMGSQKLDGLSFGKVLDNLAEDGLGTITMQVYAIM